MSMLLFSPISLNLGQLDRQVGAQVPFSQVYAVMLSVYMAPKAISFLMLVDKHPAELQHSPRLLILMSAPNWHYYKAAEFFRRGA